MNRVIKVAAKTILFSIALACVAGAIAYMLVLSIFPFPHESIKSIHYSKSIYDSDGNMLRAFTGKDDCWLMPVSLEEINSDLINATISIEDKRFFDHFGVDPKAILRALRLNVVNKEVISGASTISMQVMRLAKPKKRTFFNKIIESVHAIRLEQMYTKKEILKLYFELAPYGGNINGVKAASLRYFKKLPNDLSLSECALLAGLPQAPSYLRPDRYPERAKKRRNRVLFSMLKNGYISNRQYHSMIKEPVIAGNYSFEFKAPHFTRFMKNKFQKESSVNTTLDSTMQHVSEVILKENVHRLKPYGITNGAIVIIENKTGELKAMVGSAEFFSKSDSGQLNGTLSRRCPGSTLKPFTYAIAFDRGLYTPGMILADVPAQYNGYEPLDYDREYRGPVTVREALVDSLNIPAVAVAERIGYRKLYSVLESLGIATLDKAPGYYGLSLTLGSCEVRLLELANAYAALARLGMYKPVKYTEKESHDERRVISEGAAYLVADILSDAKRLEAIGIYRDERIHPKVAFKTGTSYDHKDAWTICYNPEYTVGIWIGNFSGRSSKALVGIEIATPIAMQVFDQLYTNKTAPWYAKPDSVGERLVCSLSGELVSKICNHAVRDYYIKGRSIAKKCTVHRKYAEKIFEVWPKELNSWFKLNSPDYAEPPRYPAASKKAANINDNPRIVSPASGCEYFIMGGQVGEAMLPLIGQGAFDSQHLFWFINGKYFDKINVGEKIFWSMTKGVHEITCSDSYGRSSTINITVR